MQFHYIAKKCPYSHLIYLGLTAHTHLSFIPKMYWHMVNNILKNQHFTPTVLWNNPISKYNVWAHQPHFARCQKNTDPGKNSQKEMKHIPCYQISFSALHCFLKMVWNYSDILCMPWINNNTLIDILKLSGDKVQKQKYLVLCNIKEAYIKFKETHKDIAISFLKCSGLLERPKLFFVFGTCITYVCTILHNMKLMMQVEDRCAWVQEMISMGLCVTLKMITVCTVCVLHVLVQKH
jgi:hypothetical protein